MQRILIESDHVEGVPLLTILPEGATHCPIVFAVHGFRGDKAAGIELGYRLAHAGIARISVGGCGRSARYAHGLHSPNRPLGQTPSVRPEAIALQLGNTDTNAPKAGTIALYRQLRPHYAACPERLQLRIYANTDHRVTREMIADACDWFRHYLHPNARQ